MLKLRNANSYILFFMWIITTLLFVISNSTIGIIAVWMLLLLFRICTEKKIKFGVIKYKDISFWFIIVLYSTIVTSFNYIVGQNNLNSIYQCMIIYILPFWAITVFSKKCNTAVVLNLIRNFVLLCCMFGIIESVLKIQPYSTWINNIYARNNFELYGNVTGALYSYRITLFFYHPIFYSEILSCALAILLYKPFKNRTINICSFFLIFVNLILTKSRTGWISGMIVIALYLIDTRREKLTKKKFLDVLKAMIGIIALVACIYTVKPEIFSALYSIVAERILQLQENTAAGARLANLSLIELSLRTRNFISILIGGGRNYSSILLANNPSINGWTNAVDNQYLTFLLDYGVIGLILLIMFYFKMLHKFLTSKHWEISVLTCIILSVAVGSIFFEYYNMNTIYYLLLICIVFADNIDKHFKHFGDIYDKS